jgi:hypothetical protein
MSGAFTDFVAVNCEQALSFLETRLKPENLNDVQVLVFRQAWEKRAYQDMAESSTYDPDYLRNVGSSLWRSLSEALGEKVTKSNFRSVIRRHARQNPNVSELASAALLMDERQLPNSIPLVLSQQELSKTKEVEKIVRNGKGSQCPKFTDWGEATETDIFLNRTAELATVEQWIVRDRCCLVALLGMGGVGKTALAAKIAEQTQVCFDYLIWRSLHHAPPIREMLAELIQFLSKGQETNFPENLTRRIARLKYYLRSSRCLLVLDNFESVLQSGTHRGAYREDRQGYSQLLKAVGSGRHQSCLVITSREKPIGLASKEGKSFPVRSLYLNGLSEVEASRIVAAKGLRGAPAEFKEFSHRYTGNPYALKIAATAIEELFKGSLTEFLAESPVVFGEICDLLKQQFNRLSNVEKQVICWLTEHQKQVTLPELKQDFVPLLSESELIEALQSLQRRSLIEPTVKGFKQNSLVREYITQQQVCHT